MIAGFRRRAALAAALAVGVAIHMTPATARGQGRPPVALAAARQLVLVVAAGWDDTTAVLRRYVRAGARAPWRPVGSGEVPVVLGRGGLAWGAGQGSIPPRGALLKREGDGRSPAGAFGLLHGFGFADEVAPGAAPGGGSGLPYLRVTPGTVCVDDPASPLYNVVADAAAAAGARWTSAERMREVAGYATGVVVAYNGARTRAGGLRLAAPGGPAVPGRGSCIFLHVWDGPARPTAGCTAMAAADLRALVGWLDPRARPVVVQLTDGARAALRDRWGLPDPPPAPGG